MSKNFESSEENKVRVKRNEQNDPAKRYPEGDSRADTMTNLQQTIGNRAVQRLLAQRKTEGPFELDDETANRIQSQRGGGQALEAEAASTIGGSLGYDLSGVKVHTSHEDAQLSQDLNAKAFTTGQDIFFNEGTYDPHSSAGQELLAHEMTHVVQQGTGAVSGNGPMRVNAPGDVYEQQADASAREALSPGTAGEIHRQEVEPEEDDDTIAQTDPLEEDDDTIAQMDPLEDDENVSAQQ
jgi:hypothetical protein